MLNLLLSFVTFMISATVRFVSSFKLPLGFGLVVYLMLSGMASAEASELLVQCGGYGKLSIDHCDQLAARSFEKFLAFVGTLVLLISALAVYRQEQRKRVEEIEERNKFFK